MTWTTDKRIALADEIENFLKKHAIPDPHEPDCLFGSGANQLQSAASMLKMGRVPICLNSSWDDGGYQHHKNVQAREWHDRLVTQVKELMNLTPEQVTLGMKSPDQIIQEDLDGEVKARSNPDRFALANEILDFLKQHAKLNPNRPSEYNSPDADQLFTAAERLKEGKLPATVWSDWGSGGYKPYTDDAAKAWHDRLVSQVQALMDANSQSESV